MLYRIAADAVMVLHFAFIVFIAAGALLAWRWPRLVWLHLPALAWGAGTVTLGFPCPLTGVEKDLRRLAGTEGYAGGFVDHYIEDVVYPDEYSAVLRAVAVVIIVVGYLGLRRRVSGSPAGGATSRKRSPVGAGDESIVSGRCEAETFRSSVWRSEARLSEPLGAMGEDMAIGQEVQRPPGLPEGFGELGHHRHRPRERAASGVGGKPVPALAESLEHADGATRTEL